MVPLAAASVVLVVGSLVGLAGAGLYALLNRGKAGGLTPRLAMARAGSYAGLAAILLGAGHAGVVGMALLFGLLGAAALLEWSRLFTLPAHHALALVAAHAVVIGAVAAIGTAATPALLGGVVLAGVVWPVLRPDTGRAIRDLGYAAVGAVLVTVMLAHGVALVFERGDLGVAILLALAAGCAGADVGGFLVGRSFGRRALAPRLSPNKTVEGLVGSLLGAAFALALFGPALIGGVGPLVFAALVAIVAAGSVWGDLLESAAKREAGVKDAGHWLPGFGGILDRIDSLLVVVALGYWVVRLSVPA